MWVKKIFWPKLFLGLIFFARKNLGRKKFGLKEILAEKNFGSKKILAEKNVGQKKVWVKKNWGSKKNVGNFFA